MEKRKKKTKRRNPKRLSTILYCYLEPENNRYARSYGRKNFGSFSAYIDALIALDRKTGQSLFLAKNQKNQTVTEQEEGIF